MDELTRRNTESMSAKLKEMSSQIDEQHIRIDSLHNTISGMGERMNQLEQMVFNFKVKLTGTGASV